MQPARIAFILVGLLFPVSAYSGSTCRFPTLSGKKPLEIAHRGASGYRPEHTLAAYQMAMDLGADFIEPDLVSTKDGYLIARHEPNIIDTTDVKSRPAYSSRRKSKKIDGHLTEGYFTEDFTLKEIKSLRAVQSHSYRDLSYDGLFEIPTFDEIVQLVQAHEERTGRKVGIYPETKHPSYFRALGLPLEEKLLDTLIIHKFTDPERVFIQSFEVSNLRDTLTTLMKAKAVRFPLLQLYGDFQSIPYDFTLAGQKQTYGDLAKKEALISIVAKYATGIGPWKDSFILKEKLNKPQDIDGNGKDEARQRLKGVTLPLVADAHAAKLQVHPYTLRNEERFGTVGYQSVIEEMRILIAMGVDGIFSDYPDSIKVALDTYCKAAASAKRP